MESYEADFYAWAQEQAALLRAGRLGQADIANIAEEIETLGRSEKRELVNRLAVLLTHLLKWGLQPDLRGKSWRLTITEQRERLHEHLDDNPSLRSALQNSFDRAYKLARIMAERETELDAAAFPQPAPWTPDQAMDDAFYPE